MKLDKKSKVCQLNREDLWSLACRVPGQGCGLCRECGVSFPLHVAPGVTLLLLCPRGLFILFSCMTVSISKSLLSFLISCVFCVPEALTHPRSPRPENMFQHSPFPLVLNQPLPRGRCSSVHLISVNELTACSWEWGGGMGFLSSGRLQ